MKTPILIRPSWSTETKLSAKVADDLYVFYRKHGIDPIVLRGVFTLKPIVNTVLQSVSNSEKPPHLLIYIGHGLKDSLMGVQPITLRFPSLKPLSVGNTSRLKDYIIHSVSCNSLESLGPNAIKSGAFCYFGTRKPLHVLTSDIDGDGVSDFVDLFTTIPKSLATGRSTVESFQDYQNVLTGIAVHTGSSSKERLILEQLRSDFRMLGSDVRWLDK